MALILSFLFLLLLGSTAGALDDCQSIWNISVDPKLSSGCDYGSSTCSNLQTAVEAVTSAVDTNGTHCVEIAIPSGRHSISASALFNSLAIRIVGQDSILVCEYAYSNGSVDYTWYFNQTQSVVMVGLSFMDCPFPLRLDTVTNVEVTDCSFRNFQEAVLDVYNCQIVLLTGSLFQHNLGTGIVSIPYRGNTGAVSVGFNDVPSHLPSPNITIQNCQFINNSATAQSTFETSNQAFTNQFFTGRGGGLGIFINESLHNITIMVSGCRFQDNSARSFGGGMYIVFNGEMTQHFFTMEQSEIVSNMALLGGGGVQLSYISNGVQETPHTGTFTDCHFYGNKGEAGGGIYVYPSFRGGDGNLAILKRCVFVGNEGVGTLNDYGSAVAVSLLSLFTPQEFLSRHEIIDCMFINNTAAGQNGIVSIGYAPMVFKGTNAFIGNQGTALRIVGSLVELFGEMQFIENVAPDGSALYLLSFAQLHLRKGLKMSFLRNIGRFGSSIRVESQTTSTVFDRLTYNPQCFVLYENFVVPPSEWSNVSIEFNHNQAVLASSLFISSLDSCSFVSFSPPFFNNSYLLSWPIWKFGNDTNTGYSDPTNRDYYVGTFADRVSTDPDSVEVWPGYRFRVTLQGINQLGHQTIISARFLPMSNQSSTVVKLEPEIVVTSNNGTLLKEFQLTFALSSTSRLLQQGQSLAEVTVDLPFQPSQFSADTFSVYPLVCPGGYTLTSSTSAGLVGCTCKDIPEIIDCEDDQTTILLSTAYWAVMVPGGVDRTLEFLTCPAGYCRCSQNTSVASTACIFTYDNSDPDQQCVCNRKGVLCGECRNNSGVSALLDNCVSCHDASGLLILVLIVADVAVFSVLVLLDIPLPAWLYPFIFYIQLAPYAGLFFTVSFSTVGKYLYFIGSALSFYFVYDFCLYDGMSPAVAYLLRYIPLVISTVTTIIIIVIRRMHGMKPLQAHGPWWIIILLYSHLVYTSMSILNCPRLRGDDGFVSSRWFVNGEMQCFTGGHIPLALWAIAILAVCASVIPLAVVISLGLIQRYRVLRKLTIALTENYREECKWWSAVELGRRFLFLLFLIPFPRVTVAPVLVLSVSTTIYGFVQPLKSRAANVLEVVIQVMFILLLMMKMTYDSTSDLETVLPPVTEDFLSSIASEDCSDRLTGIAEVVWILLPFYYAPLLLLLIVALVYLGMHIRRKVMERREQSLARVNTVTIVNQTVVTTQELVVEVEEGQDSGYISLRTTNTPVEQLSSRL